MTDTRGHWAADAIARVVRAGVIEPFANHTFQPRQRLRRSELASAVSRLLTLLPQASRPTAVARMETILIGMPKSLRLKRAS